MATNEDACARAVAASQELIAEKCDDEPGELVELGSGAFIYVPASAQEEFEFDLAAVDEVDDMESAIASCMDSEWARDWAESVIGDDAGEEAIEAAKRRACEGFFD